MLKRFDSLETYHISKLRILFTIVLVSAIAQQSVSVLAQERNEAKIPHIGLREMLSKSDCVLVAEVFSVDKEKQQEYLTIHPVEQIKGKISDKACLRIYRGEGRLFDLKPGSVAILCLIKMDKTGKTKNVYRDAYAGRGTMPILSAKEAKVVEVDTTILTNIPLRKLERGQLGSHSKEWRNYYSFYAYDSFLSAIKNLVVTQPTKYTNRPTAK